MKVVLFCGGFGTRLREHSETIPKPLVPIGARPILWHLMKYYAHHGHREFVLCLGYGGHHIRQFFMGYDARESEDFVMRHGASTLVRAETDVPDWTIHFVDTGLHANIGQRLLAVRHLVADEEAFLANYSDQLSSLPLGAYVSWFFERDAIASIVAVRVPQSFHTVDIEQATGRVTRLQSIADGHTWVNGGFMLMRPTVFDYINAGEELVEQPFNRLVTEGKLAAYPYRGFWKPMDTFKDKLAFDEMDARGERPWACWR
jgi:glucose-1-phosphate cytidylyltransferase